MPQAMVVPQDWTTYDDTTALEAVDTTNYVDGVYAVIPSAGFYKFSKHPASTPDVVPTTGGGGWDLTYPTDAAWLAFQSDGTLCPFQVTSVGNIDLADGTAAAPSLAFVSDQDSGLYYIGATSFGVSVAGTLRWTFGSTGHISTVAVTVPDGTAAAPGLRTTTTAHGLYEASTTTLGVAVDGSNAVTIAVDSLNLVSGSAYQIDGTQVLGAPISGYVVPAGSAGALRDMSSTNVDSATADDATVRLILRYIKAAITDNIAHGFWSA